MARADRLRKVGASRRRDGCGKIARFSAASRLTPRVNDLLTGGDSDFRKVLRPAGRGRLFVMPGKSEGIEMQVANLDGAIRERAYAIWEEEGRPHGRDWEHWYRAMQEIAGPIAAPAARNGSAHAAPKARQRKNAKAGIREALKSALS
jgi:hypothetical protein